MLFNSLTYLVFLAIAVSVYRLSASGVRTYILLLASLAFYAFWRVDFVLLVCLSACVDYFFALRIAAAQSTALRRFYFLTSLSINIGLLLYFKYSNFILANAQYLSGHSVPDWVNRLVSEIVLPLGISFYTFLSISYT